MAAVCTLDFYGVFTHGGRVFKFNSESTPFSITLTNDLVYEKQVTVEPSTVAHVFRTDGNSPDIDPGSAVGVIIAVAEKDGTWGWKTSVGGDLGSVQQGWRANVPLILSSGSTIAYNATLDNRVIAASAKVQNLYFYHEQDDNVLVRILALS